MYSFEMGVALSMSVMM